MLICRLTRDPELHTFEDGGAVVNFGVAVNNNRWNKDTQAWDSVGVFFDCKAFDSTYEGGRKLATLIARTRKGEQHYVEGHFVMEEWKDKETGARRSKNVIVVDNFQFLTWRDEEGAGQPGQQRQGTQARQATGRPQDRPAPQGRPQARPAARPASRPAPATTYHADPSGDDDYSGYPGNAPGSASEDEEDQIPF